MINSGILACLKNDADVRNEETIYIRPKRLSPHKEDS